MFNSKYRSINSFYCYLIVNFSNNDFDFFFNCAREFFLRKTFLFNLNNNLFFLFNFNTFSLKDRIKTQNKLSSFNNVTIEINLKIKNQFNDLTNWDKIMFVKRANYNFYIIVNREINIYFYYNIYSKATFDKEVATK